MYNERLAEMAEETCDIVRDGFYTLEPETRKVYICKERGPTSALIHPDDWDDLENRALFLAPLHKVQPALSIEPLTTLQAAQRLSCEVKEGTGITGGAGIMVLNFASARNPGGGWLRGAEAQEESLARASDLVASLERWPRYYRVNKESNQFYTDHAIWSPDVTFFRDDYGHLQPPWMANVLTIPAPNLSRLAADHKLRLDAEVILFRRISYILTAAAFYRQRHLVLGAWGCGVFANDPAVVAKAFRDNLDRWGSYFDQVVFAIHDTTKDQKVLNQFQETFK